MAIGKLHIETQERYITHNLEMIYTSKNLIAALELKAVQFPDLADDIGRAIKAEKQQIKFHHERLGV